MCSTLELPTQTVHPLLHGVTSCDYGWQHLRAKEGGGGRLRTAHTRSAAGYRSTIKKRPARWMRSENLMRLGTARKQPRPFTQHRAYTVYNDCYDRVTCQLSKGDKYQTAATAAATPAPKAACCICFLRIWRRTSFTVVGFIPPAAFSIASQSSQRVVLVALHKPTKRTILVSIGHPSQGGCVTAATHRHPADSVRKVGLARPLATSLHKLCCSWC